MSNIINLPYKNTDDFELVEDLLFSGENVFLTGAAGTGKSYILHKLIKKYGHDFITLTSTTGVSAYNIQGQTIHSWAGVGIMDEAYETVIHKLRKRTIRDIKNCTILAIDEISMLSAYAIEYLNGFFQTIKGNNLPFGGIQVLFIGDFLQLPPVCTKEDAEFNPKQGQFCFESPVWNELNLHNVVLEKIYRQQDINFIKILSDFRKGVITKEAINELETRIIKDDKKFENILHLFPIKKDAQNYNKQQLDKIKEKEFLYESIDKINLEENHTKKNNVSYKKMISKALNDNCQAEEVLLLKKGCRVMLLKNMFTDKGLVNGACGTVIDLNEKSILVKFDNGITFHFRQEVFDYSVNGHTLATRIQMPLKLAYAITIHKSQGLTLSEAVIDIERAFTCGQGYVALSRIRSLSNLYITRFKSNRIFPNTQVVKFYSSIKKTTMEDLKQKYVQTVKI